ncbi:MAG: hypothetical protein ACRDHL_15890 [Candidatus Promineifilaceae bacterium]
MGDPEEMNAGDQGQTSDDNGASWHAPAASEGQSGIPDWLEAELQKAVPDEASMPDWLRAELARDRSVAEAEPADAPMPAEQASPEPGDGVYPWEGSEATAAPVDTVADDDLDDLSWLDEIVAEEQAAMEETPGMDWSDQGRPRQPAGATADQEDLDWLAGMIEADDEAETVQQEADSAFNSLLAEAGAAEAELPANLAEEVPEDPDEAMAWLERLAAQQGAAAEEMTTMTPAAQEMAAEPAMSAAEPAGTEMTEMEAEGVPAEEERWLTMEAEPPAAQADEEAPPEFEEPELEGVEADVWPAGGRSQAEPAAAEDFEPDLSDVEMPRDADEALAWFNELAGISEGDIEPTYDELTILDVELFEVVEGPAEAEPDDAMAALMEDDSDDSMAWLERLAGRQGADFNEMTLVTEVEEIELVEPETPTDEIPAAEEPGMDEMVMEEMAEEPTGVEAMIEGAAADVEAWVTADDERAGAGATGLEDVSWLEMEDEAGAEEWLMPPDEPLEEVATALEEEPLPAEMMAEPEEAVEPDARPEQEGAQLALAAGDFEEAASQFGRAVEQGRPLQAVIAELESAASEHEGQPHLLRALGDAYVRNGQLEKALEVYRRALDAL